MKVSFPWCSLGFFSPATWPAPPQPLRPSHQGLYLTKGEPCWFQQASFILSLGRNEVEVDRRHQMILRYGTSQVTVVIDNPSANARDTRDTSSISGSERSPGGGHGNPLQCSCLENPHGQRAWGASTVYRTT